MSTADSSVRHVLELDDEAYRRWTRYGCGDTEHTPSADTIVLKSFKDPHFGISKTLLGAGPLTLIELFGLHDDLFSACVRNAVARCLSCDEAMKPPRSAHGTKPPACGYVALSVELARGSISLQEHCELLGAVRAIVGDRLVSVPDIDSEQGAPVVAVAPVEDFSRVVEEASRWLVNGGGVLTLWHFSERSGQGIVLRDLAHEWICTSCGVTEKPLDKQQVQEEPECTRCKGKGGLFTRGIEETVCADCRGVGRISRLSRFNVSQIALQDLRACSFSECLHIFESREEAELCEKIEMINHMGFGDYSMGYPVSWLSPGERCFATVVCARLSGVSDTRFLIDGAEVGSMPDALKKRFGEAVTLLCLKQPARPQRVATLRDGTTNESTLIVRNLSDMNFAIEELCIPMASVTSIQGESGCGKSRLLLALQERFRARNKTVSQDDFKTIAKCSYIDSQHYPKFGSVIEALGIEDLLASEIASKREAQKLGLVASDLNIRQSRYRCEACLDADDYEASQEVCPVCRGARYTRVVADMSVGKESIHEIMTGACSRLVEVAWRSDELAVISEVLGAPCFDQIALGDPLSKFSPLDRSFIAMFGGLLRMSARCFTTPKRGREGGKPELVLIDGPYMLCQDHIEPLSSLLKRICDDGHTIVYAGMPKALEFSEAAVIRLGSRMRPREERIGGVSLQQRYGRCIMVL